MNGTSEVVVKVSTQHPAWPFLRQSPAHSGRWGRYRFVFDDGLPVADAWIVCEGLLQTERAVCPPDRTILVTWEPPRGVRPRYPPAFLRQFAVVLTCHRGLRHPNVRYGLQGHPWFVERTYDALKSNEFPPTKSVELVGITSNKAFSSGHRARLRLLFALKERLGDRMQLVGRGVHDFEAKWEVLAPAKYAVVVENSQAENWLTEKLPDAFLAGAFPFYNGAPNAGALFDQRSFIPIPLDAEAAAARIVNVLDDAHHYEQSLPHLVEARRRYLDELQFFPLLAGLLGDLGVSQADRLPLEIHPERPPTRRWRLMRKLLRP